MCLEDIFYVCNIINLWNLVLGCCFQTFVMHKLATGTEVKSTPY